MDDEQDRSHSRSRVISRISYRNAIATSSCSSPTRSRRGSASERVTEVRVYGVLIAVPVVLNLVLCRW